MENETNDKTENQTATSESDQIFSELADGFPEPSGADVSAAGGQPPAPQAEQAAPTSTPAPSGPDGILRDAQGFTFDASVHKTDFQGRPILTKKGLLSRKSGNRPGSNGRGKSTPQEPPASRIGGTQDVVGPTLTPTQAPVAAPSADLIAELVTNAGVGLRLWFGGAEAKPAEVETAMLKDAARAWAVHNNFDCSPNMAFALAVGMFTLPAIFTPKGAARIDALVKKFASKKAEPPKPTEEVEGDFDDPNFGG